METALHAEQLTGHRFFPHPDVSTLGVLQLDTENEQHWVLVTRADLRRLSAALAAHTLAVSDADLIEDSELRLMERAYATEVYRDARIAAQATRNGVVIDSAITAAMLLILGSLWEAREDVVIGASVAALPFGAYSILNQWRKGPGL